MSVILMKKDFGGDLDLWGSLCEEAAAKSLIPSDYNQDEVEEITVQVSSAEHGR